jgi:predicted DNA-binding protein (UPF0251 family)
MANRIGSLRRSVPVMKINDAVRMPLLCGLDGCGKRRGRTPKSVETDRPARPDSTGIQSPAKTAKSNPTEVSLTRGQLNAVRSVFKAGITPSRIAREFGISLSDVRQALARDETKR